MPTGKRQRTSDADRGKAATRREGADVAVPTARPPADLDEALDRCDGARSFADVDRAFQRHVAPVLHELLHQPLVAPLADNVAPTDCCSPAVLAARSVISAYDDVKLLTFRLAAGILRGVAGGAAAASTSSSGAPSAQQRQKLAEAAKKQAASSESDEALIANVYCLLYGVTFGKLGKATGSATLRWEALAAEKASLEKSEAYANSNAAERRALQLKTVLVVFSDRGRRHEFSALWSAFTGLPSVPGPLRLHFLTSIGTHILPFLTRPVTLSDYLADCFTRGGLTAILALEGLFVLILEHGLEYPSFYDKLYSLVTPDAFSSRHRNQLFRLVNLALTSVRVPAYVVAGFIKRVARVLLLAPAPTFYFALPFVRQLFQRHPNCLPLIHRTDGAEELFDGKDPFDPFEDKLDKCRAIDSTLWELCVLERHYIPAINLMVSAFSSPAQDNAPLKFEKTYGRLFAQDITRSKSDDPGVVSYKAPPPDLLAPGHKEAGLKNVFVV